MLTLLLCLLLAILSYLENDPASPFALVREPKDPRPQDDPELVKRGIEDYDYLLADPWGVGLSPRERAGLEENRAGLLRMLDETGGEPAAEGERGRAE